MEYEVHAQHMPAAAPGEADAADMRNLFSTQRISLPMVTVHPPQTCRHLPYGKVARRVIACDQGWAMSASWMHTYYHIHYDAAAGSSTLRTLLIAIATKYSKGKSRPDLPSALQKFFHNP